MKVLPEQILAWLKSTFGKDEANQVNIHGVNHENKIYLFIIMYLIHWVLRKFFVAPIL